MSEISIVRVSPIAQLRDLVELGKPRLSLLVIFTSAVGVWLAPVQPTAFVTLGFVIATSGLVAAANTLNCWIEVEIDALMQRTCNRPLPAGRLEPRTALLSGLTLGFVSLTALYATSNLLTLLLGASALVSYVLIYTPLKRVTPWAVLVGAVPGALPPLMGWTAATGTISAPGAYLFGILFLWQLPHFIAISVYLREDFRRGGLPVLPLVHGERIAGRQIVISTALIAGFGVCAQPLGIAGPVYTVVAAALGAGFLAVSLRGPRGDAPGGPERTAAVNAWARRVFGYSLLYLPILVATLVLAAL
jgi:protoheme IX farnesyltransferase